MTKQQFIALADYLRDTRADCEPFTDRQLEFLADFCKTINPNFDRERWLDYIRWPVRTQWRHSPLTKRNPRPSVSQVR